MTALFTQTFKIDRVSARKDPGEKHELGLHFTNAAHDFWLNLTVWSREDRARMLEDRRRLLILAKDRSISRPSDFQGLEFKLTYEITPQGYTNIKELQYV